jgi:hypothetical protein
MMTMNAHAQKVDASASQTIQLELTDAIEITFDGTGTNTGSVVKFQFSNPNQYASGLQSAEYILTIRSNKKFNLVLNTSTPNFTYSGAALPAPMMPVAGVLSLMLTQNTTGGNTSSPFALNQYGAITSMAQTVMATCSNGGNQQLAVKYKAEPGFGYPGGTYSVDAVYTATQM